MGEVVCAAFAAVTKQVASSLVGSAAACTRPAGMCRAQAPTVHGHAELRRLLHILSSWRQLSRSERRELD